MITVDYGGRTGNNMFQYAFARIIAERNELALKTEWPYSRFIEATPCTSGEEYQGIPIFIRDLAVKDHNQLWHLENYKGKRVHIKGFFQNPMYYDSNKDLVKSIWKTKPIQKRASTDIVIHLRVGDYMDKGLRSVINPNWHQLCLLKHLKMDPRRDNCKIYIVIENSNDPILKYYNWMKPRIVSHPNPKDDFEFIRSFDNIICSNSSFCWWAAYLSEATKILTFEPWLQFPKNEHIKLAYMDRAIPVKGGFYL